jgi:hypothetical protein
MQINDPEAALLRSYMDSAEFEQRSNELTDRMAAGFCPTLPEMADALGLPIEIVDAMITRSGAEIVRPPEGTRH